MMFLSRKVTNKIAVILKEKYTTIGKAALALAVPTRQLDQFIADGKTDMKLVLPKIIRAIGEDIRPELKAFSKAHKKKLQEIMKYHGLQNEFAKRHGVTESQIKQFLNNQGCVLDVLPAILADIDSKPKPHDIKHIMKLITERFGNLNRFSKATGISYAWLHNMKNEAPNLQPNNFRKVYKALNL